MGGIRLCGGFAAALRWLCGGFAVALRRLCGGFAVALVKPVRQSHLFNTLTALLAEEKGEMLPKERYSKIAAENQAEPLGLRVLLAEDNSTNQKLVLRLLGKWGCRADAVASGWEALKVLASIPYDVVLMDVQMPVMDGLEATAEIRRREAGFGCRIPIIAMTANAMEGDRECCLQGGMDDYLSKPIRPQELKIGVYGVLCGLAFFVISIIHNRY